MSSRPMALVKMGMRYSMPSFEGFIRKIEELINNDEFTRLKSKVVG